MAYTKVKVLRSDIEPPKPVLQLVVRDIINDDNVILFSATQQVINEIEQFGFGAINQMNRQKSGWCALIVNPCYRFEDIVQWMYDQAKPAQCDAAA